MDLFTYLMAKKGHNTHRDLFSYLLGKNAGGSGTYTTFSGTSLNISNTLQAKIKNIALEGNTSQDGTPTPDTPIPIKVVTGEQSIKIHNKNLFDKSKVSTYTFRTIATINNDKSVTITVTDSNPHYCIISPYVFLEANTTYRISYDVDNMSGFDHMQMFVSSSTTAGGYSNTNSVTYTPSVSRGVALGVYLKANATITISNIQIEKGNTTTSYVPCQSQTYPLSLGNIELAKIENYKDYIFKNVTDSPYYNANLDLNDWYLHKEIIGENLWEKAWVYESESSTPVPRTVLRLRNMSTIHVYFSNCFLSSEMNNQQIVNRLKTDSPNWFLASANNLTGIETTDSNNIKLNKITTFLQSISANIYYGLITPTNTKITDTTLVSQLENINNNARSYKDTTIIECTSESTDNETIGFSGDIKVTSVGLGNSLNTSLLSNNIQEETNIDDIQEEPNLDDVNKIEDIEQNDEPIENEEIEEPIEEYQEL